MNESLKEQLIRHEGLKLRPYKDSVGKLTIGVGHNLDDKPMSKAALLQQCDDDIQDAINDLNETLPWVASLDWPRKNVLINMTFNLGIDGLLEFRNTLASIQEGNWKAAHDHMLDSKWAKQVGGRAIELARIILTGEWPLG